MAQNIYDDPAFFAGYSEYPRAREGLKGAGEWPALAAMLPPLDGLQVLDLGCGFGYHCEWAAHAGAARIDGIDLSEKMLEAARRRCAGLPVSFTRADLETADFGTGVYDLVFSSLAVHYIEDFDGLCNRVRRALRDDARFVFSMEHPVYAARADPEFVTDSRGRRVGAVDEYLREGERRTNWIADGVIKYHRLISTTVMSLKHSGFELEAIDEWRPGDAVIAAHPEWEAERYEPMFLLVAARAAGHGPN